MRFYSNNIKILKEKDGKLAERIEKVEISDKYRIFPSKIGFPTLEVNLPDKKITLHSTYDPLKEAEKFVSSFDLKNKEIIVIYGFGFGYHIEEILRRVPENVDIWVLEGDEEIFKLALIHRDLERVFKRNVKFFVGKESVSEIREYVVRYFTASHFLRKEIALINYHPSIQTQLEVYQQLSTALRDAVTLTTVSANTSIFIAIHWPSNTWRSITSILKGSPVSNVFGKFKNKPAIVVAAGPSLNENIECLKKAVNKALIICVGTAYRVLLNNGIIPDVVVTVDALHYNYKHFEGLFYNTETFLIVDPMAYYKILEDFKGPIFITEVSTLKGANPTFSWLKKYIGELGILSGGFSVATVGFDFANKAGANPIIFVGQDLSFPGKKSHAEGTAFNIEIDEKNPSYLKVPNNSGGEVLTSKVWLSTIRQFEAQIKNVSAECINTSLKGAKIEGTRVIPFEEVANIYLREEFSPKEILKSSFSQISLSQEKIEMIVKDIEKILKNFQKIKEKSERGIKLASKLLGMILQGEGETEKRIKLQIKTQELINSLRNSEGMEFLHPYLQELYLYLNRTEKVLEEGETKLSREVKRAGVYCQGVFNVLEDVTPIIEEARDKLKNEFLTK